MPAPGRGTRGRVGSDSGHGGGTAGEGRGTGMHASASVWQMVVASLLVGVCRGKQPFCSQGTAGRIQGVSWSCCGPPGPEWGEAGSASHSTVLEP